MGYPQGADEPPANGQRILLTPTDVASFLQVKLPRVYELVRARRLRALRIGRQLRFRPEDLEAFLERSTTGRW
jgi:excisionase family DNA binding protein